MSTGELHVVVASDDLFSMPLTAAARSAILRAADPATVRVTVIDCGISERNRQRIRRSLSVDGAQVRIVPFTHHVPESALQGGVIPSVATFARLFAADYVPDADRAVYLDSDTIAITDLTALVDLLEPEMLVAGVADGQGDGMVRNIDRLVPLLPTDVPGAIDSPYINAGVLVMNLAAWRREGVTERLQKLVDTTPLRFADQDAVNIVCAGRVQALPSCWNTQTHLLASHARSVLTDPAIDPRIVHYTNRPKPWHLHGDVGMAEPWYDAVDHTAWRGWRPTQRRLLVPKLRRGWRMVRTRPGQLFAKYLPGSSRRTGH
jgi:lipopolysaccharide biosynthesis glycosyltransferase